MDSEDAEYLEQVKSALAQVLSAYQAATGDRDSLMVENAMKTLEQMAYSVGDGVEGRTFDGRTWRVRDGKLTWK